MLLVRILAKREKKVQNYCSEICIEIHKLKLKAKYSFIQRETQNVSLLVKPGFFFDNFNNNEVMVMIFIMDLLLLLPSML